MKKNVGTIDASIRITMGLAGLAYATARMCRRPYRTPGFLLFMSAMKVAEGITRFCPMLKMMGLSTKREDMMEMILNKTLRSSLGKATKKKEKAAVPSEYGSVPGGEQLDLELDRAPHL